MGRVEKGINLVLIGDKPEWAALLQNTMEKVGIRGVIRRIEPGTRAVDCARKSGAYRAQGLPDLIFFDFTDPGEEAISLVRKIAFGEKRALVPVVLLTDGKSQELLDSGIVGESNAIMFSPTRLPSFVGKMKNGQRSSFFRALDTLYQYGPILVRLPESAEHRAHETASVPA